MILTSTRAVPNAPLDRFSDYDMILALTDVQPFFAGRDWLAAFGRVLVMYRDPLEQEAEHLKSGNVVQFDDGLKIDFTLWAVEILRQVVAKPQLPPEFDAGYQVLLDKDGLTTGLQPPTYRAYMLRPPTEQVYRETIENCLLDATYVAKLLWRADVMAAKEILDIDLLHRVAVEVGEQLGYTYPQELEERTRAYLHKVKSI
jgi:aminoglycoside 6-adenylyltransferase